jgi:hypothetical protein
MLAGTTKYSNSHGTNLLVQVRISAKKEDEYFCSVVRMENTGLWGGKIF